MAGRLLILGFLLVGAFVPRGHAEALISPKQFTALFAEAARKSMPDAKVKITGELTLRVDFPSGRYATTSLGNAYTAYEREPDRRDAIIAQYVEHILKNMGDDALKIDAARVIPVIRTRRFPPIVEAERDPAKGRVVFERFGADLVIIYAEDRPQDLRYFSTELFEETGIDRKQLRALAIENLRRIVGDIEYKDYGGTYVLIADGANEVSLLLLPEVWTKQNLKVDGDYVVALPTRDILVVTGSNDVRALRQVRRLAEEGFQKGPYSVSPKLYRFRDGRLTQF